MSTSTPAPQGMSTGRLEAFSDGVFSIVITLLVLELRLPPGDAPLHDKLLAIWPKIVTFASTFIFIGIYWVGHHGVFHLIRRVDKTLLWINLALLLSITFVPFPAAVLGEHPLDPVAIRFYCGSAMVVGAGFTSLYLYTFRSDCHGDVVLDEETSRILLLRCLIAPVIYALAFCASYIEPRASLALFVLVPLIYIPPNRLDVRHLRH